MRSGLVAAILAASVTVFVQAAVDAASSGTVTGIVFNDMNGDGVRDTETPEPGVAGSVVNAYDSEGTLVGTATTGADGAYSLTVTNAASNDLRIEFSTPSGYRPSPQGADNGTSIQFVSVGATGADYGVLIPTNYCADNLDQDVGSVVATCYYPGATTWTPAGYNRGTVKVTGWNTGNSNVTDALAANGDTGALWGVGVQPTTGLVFTSAVVRRHADLGPEGIGGIYVMRSGEAGIADSYDLTTLYPGVQFTDDVNKWTRAARDIATPGTVDSTDPSLGLSQDIPGWSAVGTEGIGDIDVSDDSQFLWVMNLYEKTLLRIALDGDRATPGLGALTEFPVPTDICQVAGSNERPWAIDPQPDGTVRIGVVCDNAASQDTSAEFSILNFPEGAYVYSLDPAANAGAGAWSELLTVDMASRTRYDRACGVPNETGNPSAEDGRCWGAWLASWDSYTSPSLLELLPQHVQDYPVWEYGQPMLVDIDTLVDGSMVLNFNDRTSMQFGWYNEQPTTTPEISWSWAEDINGNPIPNFTYVSAWVMGDSVLACSTGASSWNVEQNGSCSGTNSYSGVADADDPGSSAPFGEFFRDHISDAHFEVTSGGLATRPGAPGVASAVMDPCDLFSGGIRWLSTTDGTITACAVYTGAEAAEDINKGDLPIGFSKSSSMGDLEFLCDAAPIEIGNRIWVDVDKDGIQDPGEQPIAGVTVNLYDASGVLVGSAITDAFGEYYFTSTIGTLDDFDFGDFDTGDNLGGGVRPYQAYTIRIDNADDWASGGVLDAAYSTLTSADQTATAGESDSIDSDFTMVDGYPELAVVPHAPGESDHTFDAGINVSLVAVGDYTWVDANADGIQDENEPPLAGVAVELYDSNGDLVAETTTDENGFYLFDGLLPGDYQIYFGAPDGYSFTEPYWGNTNADDSNAWFDGWTDWFTVSPSDGDTVPDTDPDTVAEFVNPTIDAGFIPPAVVAIGDYVWLDTNRDGVQDGDEPPVEGVKVELFDEWGDPAVDADGNPVAAVFTDADGLYLFDNLSEGYYYVRFTKPDGYEFTDQYWGNTNSDDSNAYSDGWTDLFYAGPGDDDTLPDTDPTTVANFINPTIDAGLYLLDVVAIGDYTWFDENRDGVQDDGEAPVQGVKVELFDTNGDPAVDADGNPIAPVYTDAKGFYLFDNLLEGEYRILFTAPDGYDFTEQYWGNTSADDSNADPADGWTDWFWVNRWDGDTVVDSDPSTLAVYVNPTIDAGFVRPDVVAIGDYTWIDTNRDGLQDDSERPVAGVMVELYDANGDPAVDADGNPVEPVYTDEHGYYFIDNLLEGDYQILFTPPTGYEFTDRYTGDSAFDSNADPGSGWTDVFTVARNDADTVADTDPSTKASFVNPTIDAGFIAPPVAMGDYVWFDLDGDGIQDPSEEPIEGVSVQLLNPDGSVATDASGDPLDPVFTDADGYYFIDNLVPGDYQAQFTLPNGLNFAFTQQAAGSDSAVDSNPDPSTGLTPVFSIASSVSGDTVVDTDPDTIAAFVNPTIDAGVVPVVAISNYMWFDWDLDGVRDPGEDPVEGGTVYLLDANGDPVTDADGNAVGPRTTDADGYFLFDNLLPGAYRLQFVPPPGYAFTSKGADDTDGEDSNANPDGLTDVFQVLAQPLSATSDDTDGDTVALLWNPTVGAGLVPIVAIGDVTWFDANGNGLQDAGEAPVAAVRVDLLNADGSPALDADGRPVAPATTDANGRYLFDNLLPGEYRVRFTPPPEYRFTLQFGGAVAGDSNADPSSGLTPVFTVGSRVGGDTVVDTDPTTAARFVNPTIDAGFVRATLPATGTMASSVLATAMVLMGIGLLLTLSRRRRCVD